MGRKIKMKIWLTKTDQAWEDYPPRYFTAGWLQVCECGVHLPPTKVVIADTNFIPFEKLENNLYYWEAVDNAGCMLEQILADRRFKQCSTKSKKQ